MRLFRPTPIGMIGIEEDHGFITHIYFETDRVDTESEIAETPLLKEAFDQLDLYLAGNLKAFTLPLQTEGTPFMKSVWQKLIDVPYGKTASYKDIARAIGNPKACRAVGMANNRNPIPIIIPCHRIIGSGGELIGYGGGLGIKKKLLALEYHYSNL